ncbi:MAG: hypothetical protein NTW54_05280 [Bacteroidetes bacterium]|nr:hypothetical protein [Bacteroidota bacterium]
MRNYLSTILLLLTFGLFAQTNTFSPYSYFGLGSHEPQNGVFSQSMGGIGQGLSNSIYVNTANPASYVANQKINFEFNLYAKLNTLQDSTGYNDFKTFNFSRITLAFPLGKKKNAGACMGIMPYSTSGYNIQRKFTAPIAHTDYYSGNGGINKLFFGAGYSFNKSLSLGANVNYLFGDINNIRVTTFDSAYVTNYYLENKTILRGVNFDLGLQYKVYKEFVKDTVKYRKDDSVYVRKNRNMFHKDSLVHLKQFGFRAGSDTVTLIFNWGVSYTTSSNSNATRDVYGVTFKDYYLPFLQKNLIVKDTAKYSIDEKGKIFIPGSVGIGFSLSNEHKSDKRNNFLVGADFNYSNWTIYRNYGNTDSLHQSYAIKLGGYYKPLKSYRSDYFNEIEYRAGAHYTRTPIVVRGTAINEYGAALGFGLPMKFKGRSSGILNLGFEIGKMGTLQNDLTTDTYYKLSLGLNLVSAEWFRHYKYE